MMAIDMTAAAALPRKYGLPLVVSSFFGSEDNFTALYRGNDVPVFDSPEKAARGMVSLLRHKEIRERKPIETPPLPARNPGVARHHRRGPGRRARRPSTSTRRSRSSPPTASRSPGRRSPRRRTRP